VPERGAPGKPRTPNLLIFNGWHLAESCHTRLHDSSGDAQREGLECSAALHAATGEPVMIAGKSRAGNHAVAGAQLLPGGGARSYFARAQPEQAAAMIDHLGTAIPVHVNLAISGLERLVRDIDMAVERRQREELRASQAAIRKLQCELNDTITALLLSTELAREPRPAAGRSSKARVSAWAGEKTPGAIGTLAPQPKKPSTPSAKQFARFGSSVSAL